MKKMIYLLTSLIVLTSCSDDNELETLNLEVGQFHEGGIIFYIDDSGVHGLVAASTDQASNIPWACQGVFYNVINDEIGTGNQNTQNITTNIETDSSCSPEIYAAKVCDDLVLEGFSDWFLPSFEELNLMHNNRLVIGNFNSWFYWSSTELDPQTPGDQNWTRVRFFGADSSDLAPFNNAGKHNHHHVRAIRAF